MTETAYFPQEIKNLAMWGCFDKNKKLISALSGFPMMASDMQALTDYRTALNFAKDNPNRIKGLAFVIPVGYLVIDIDKNEENQPIIEEWLESFDTYKETNIDNTGYHILIKATLKETQNMCVEYGIKILRPKEYVCLSGEITRDGISEVNTGQNSFERLYYKYFKKIVKSAENKRYIFGRTGEKKKQITAEEVEENISQSLASSLYYQLSSGNYKLNGFVNENDAIVVMLRILIFWTSGDQQLVYSMIRKTKIYNKGNLETQQGNGTLLDLLYENALEGQKWYYDPETYLADNYAFDPHTGITKFFKEYSLDDTGNAQRIYDAYHEILHYDTYNKVFMIYDKEKGIWVPDTNENLKVKSFADQIIEDLRVEINTPRIKNDRELYKAYMFNISKFANSKGKDNAINELKHLQDIPIDFNSFDANPMLLNTYSGVLNLRSGVILDHSPDFLMTKSTRCYVDMKNRPERFEKFMWETCCGNEELFDYLKRLIGYALTGLTFDESFYSLKGNGNNGKSVLLNVITQMLGDYAVNVQIETFCDATFQKDGSSASPDIARMKGARFVRANEPKRGMSLNESLMKQLTGNDLISCRRLRKEIFEFRPQCKIFIACNNMLKINGTTRGDWRRVKIIDFNNDVPEEKIDYDLEENLKKEIPQILGFYAMQGCLSFQEKGLKAPESVKKSVEGYRVISNTVSNFLMNSTEEKNGAITTNADLFHAYMRWCREMNEREPVTNVTFGEEVMKFVSQQVFRKRDKKGRLAYFNLELLKINDGVIKDEYSKHMDYSEDLPQ